MTNSQALPVHVRRLEPVDADACDRIVLSLPYHFGDAAGRAECSRAVRQAAGLVASHDGQVVGFLTVEHHNAVSAEITWLAVEAGQRGRGIGSTLVRRLVADLTAGGCRLLLVHTLADSYDEGGTPDGYDRTRAFYRARGFLPAREYHTLWPTSPALLFVLPLPGANSPRAAERIG